MRSGCVHHYFIYFLSKLQKILAAISYDVPAVCDVLADRLSGQSESGNEQSE
jgi:hypothetical protein